MVYPLSFLVLNLGAVPPSRIQEGMGVDASLKVGHSADWFGLVWYALTLVTYFRIVQCLTKNANVGKIILLSTLHKKLGYSAF